MGARGATVDSLFDKHVCDPDGSLTSIYLCVMQGGARWELGGRRSISVEPCMMGAGGGEGGRGEERGGRAEGGEGSERRYPLPLIQGASPVKAAGGGGRQAAGARRRGMWKRGGMCEGVLVLWEVRVRGSGGMLRLRGETSVRAQVGVCGCAGPGVLCERTRG